MLLVTTEAQLNEQQSKDIMSAFAEMLRHVLPGMEDAYLTRYSEDASNWRLVTIWGSDEAYEEAVASAPEPAMELFRKLGAEPKNMKYNIVATVEGEVS